MNVVNSYVGRDFMTAIEQRSQRELLSRRRCSTSACSRSRPCSRCCSASSRSASGLLWREWLTRVLVLGYLERGTPYRLREHGDIDNPDQRIADDVRAFTTTAASRSC